MLNLIRRIFLHIVIIEDNVDLCFSLSLLLKHNAYTVYSFNNEEDFFAQMDNIKVVDVFILDINLPDGNGITLLEDLKRYFEDSIYIVISAYTDISHISNAYKIGADDYLKKPFEIEELLLKIKKIEMKSSKSNIVKIDDLYSFDLEKKALYNNNSMVPITENEAEILFVLLSHKGKIVTFDELSMLVWKKEVSNNTINVAMKRLREKLESQFIYTIHNVGYMI